MGSQAIDGAPSCQPVLVRERGLESGHSKLLLLRPIDGVFDEIFSRKLHKFLEPFDHSLLARVVGLPQRTGKRFGCTTLFLFVALRELVTDRFDVRDYLATSSAESLSGCL